MKKISIIFIIVICLLSFMEISCLANPAEYWNYLNYFDKVVYLTGIIAGVNMWIEQLFDHTPHQFTTEEDKVKFIAFTLDNINFADLFVIDDRKKFEKFLKTFIKIMNDLYKDPVNTYIPNANMCLIASRNLRGEPIELLLRELREKALR